MRNARARALRSTSAASAASTTVSVSGRGTSVVGVELRAAGPRIPCADDARDRLAREPPRRERGDGVGLGGCERCGRTAATSAAWSRPSAWPTSRRASSSGVSRPAARKRAAQSARVLREPSATGMRACAAARTVATAVTTTPFRRQQLGLMLGHQRVDDLAERLALDDLRQLVEREIDAVVADAPLRKIVGADALGAVAGADLAAALGGARGIELLALGVVEPGCAAPPSPWRGCGAASGPPASSPRCRSGCG